MVAERIRKDVTTRKLAFRKEAMVHVLEMDEVTFDCAWELYKMDCFNCTLHDISNPKSQNCTDNPFCIKRLGLEKFENFIKKEALNAEKVAKEQVRRDIKEKPCGLVNTGNYCYVNSFLQVWFNEPVFRQIVYDWRPSTNFERPQPPRMDVQEVMNSLQRLFFILETTPFDDTDQNSSFTTALRLGNEQQDAQEFALMLFDALDRHLQKHPNGEKTRLAIRDRYMGEIQQRVWCDCGGKDRSERLPSTSIQLGVDQHKTLQDALRAHFAPELLEDYVCDACGRKGGVRKQTIADKLPNVLNLQLIRYVYDVNGRKKLKTPLAYPREFPSGWLNELSSSQVHNKDQEFDYELFAVMIHDGDNVHCGHYYDLVKHPYSQKWFKYDDHKVEPPNRPPSCELSKLASIVSRPTTDMRGCYGLVYRRKVPPVPVKLPPAEITQQWATQEEERFVGTTNEEIVLSERRLKEVNSRFAALQQLFAQLQSHADKVKKPSDVAFLPKSLLKDILDKELERTEVISRSENKKLNTEVDPEIIECTPGLVEDSPTKKKRGRLPANKIPREQISQMLNNHRMVVCPHGGVDLDSVLFGEVKAVARPAAETLLTRYAISINRQTDDLPPQRTKLLLGPDICVDCIKVLRAEATQRKQLETDEKLAGRLLKEKFRCSLSLMKSMKKPPDGYFYVAKKALQNYKKLATREIEYQNRPIGSTVELVFQANCTAGLSPQPNGDALMTSANIRRSRGRPKKRLASESFTEGEPSEKLMVAQMSEISDVAEVVEDLVLNISGEKDFDTDTGEQNGHGGEFEVLSRLKADSETISDAVPHSNGNCDRVDFPLPVDVDRPSSTTSGTDSFEGGSVVFNDDLRCPHGGVNLNEFRHYVSPDEWTQLTEPYFTQTFPVQCDQELCDDCHEMAEEEKNGSDDRLHMLRQLRDHFSTILRTIEKREVKKGELGTTYTYGICSLFINNFNSMRRKLRPNMEVPNICQECVMCDHDRPLMDLMTSLSSSKNDEPGIFPLKEQEWAEFRSKWEDIMPECFPTPIRILPNGVVEDLCPGCQSDRIETISKLKFNYTDQFIYIKIQSLTEEPAEVPVGKGTRRTQKQGLERVKVSSSDVVRSIKVKLYGRGKTQQSPVDQLLYSRLGGELLDDDVTLATARILPDNSDNPLILIAQPAATVARYTDDRPPERGFTDTALAH